MDVILMNSEIVKYLILVGHYLTLQLKQCSTYRFGISDPRQDFEFLQLSYLSHWTFSQHGKKSMKGINRFTPLKFKSCENYLIWLCQWSLYINTLKNYSFFLKMIIYVLFKIKFWENLKILLLILKKTWWKLQ